MTEEEFGQFEHESAEYLKTQQDILRNEYDMGSYERWDYDQDTGEFVFSDAGVPKVIAKFQVVGSISHVSNTWLWSWANPSILETVKGDMRVVRQFGEKHGLKELLDGKWKAEDLGFLFVIFTDVWRASA
jgi:hypothetical protein